MDYLNTLGSLGLALPTPAYLFGLLFFGIAGFAAYRYGKKAALAKPKWIGIAMMLYPYAVSETWLLYAVGAGLCAMLYVYRK
ncbi:MAG: hypothetical protein Q8Q28_04230 [Pseudomonadota bacterium]|nr:hypothetical protein [Pseudomonadota bacterium]